VHANKIVKSGLFQIKIRSAQVHISRIALEFSEIEAAQYDVDPSRDTASYGTDP